MRLTAFLCRMKPHGIKYRGKNKVVSKPSKDDLAKLQHRFERDEENMLILRHPYLTSEQSRDYMKDLKVPRPLSIVGNRTRNELFNKHFRWVDQLAHLRVRDAWE